MRMAVVTGFDLVWMDLTRFIRVSVGLQDLHTPGVRGKLAA